MSRTMHIVVQFIRLTRQYGGCDAVTTPARHQAPAHGSVAHVDHPKLF